MTALRRLATTPRPESANSHRIALRDSAWTSTLSDISEGEQRFVPWTTGYSEVECSVKIAKLLFRLAASFGIAAHAFPAYADELARSKARP
jgi:hypothetical protein